MADASPQIFTNQRASMSERRREERSQVCLEAVWDGESGNHPARVTDLSEGGCYVDTLGGTQVGEVLNLKLQLPGGEWLELAGEVAHQSPPLGFGLRFGNLTGEQMEKLRSVIAPDSVHTTDPA